MYEWGHSGEFQSGEFNVHASGKDACVEVCVCVCVCVLNVIVLSFQPVTYHTTKHSRNAETRWTHRSPLFLTLSLSLLQVGGSPSGISVSHHPKIRVADHIYVYQEQQQQKQKNPWPVDGHGQKNISVFIIRFINILWTILTMNKHNSVKAVCSLILAACKNHQLHVHDEGVK